MHCCEEIIIHFIYSNLENPILPKHQHNHFYVVILRLYLACSLSRHDHPHSKLHGANMGSTLVLSVPDGPHAGPMNLAIGPLTIAD